MEILESILRFLATLLASLLVIHSFILERQTRYPVTNISEAIVRTGHRLQSTFELLGGMLILVILLVLG